MKKSFSYPPCGLAGKGAFAGAVLAASVCAPSLVSGGLSIDNLTMTIPMILGFVVIGAWFSTLFVMDRDEQCASAERAE